jgi:hypothetical protein
VVAFAKVAATAHSSLRLRTFENISCRPLCRAYARLRRFRAIHGEAKKRIDSYLRVTKTRRCWEARGLPNADQELIALDRFTDENRDFTVFLNAWKQVEAGLK